MTTDTITQRVDELGWYHTLELPGGQVTEGMFDLRNQMHHYGLPERMDGMRALDVGTWDGFWAFEMERRGAERHRAGRASRCGAAIEPGQPE